MSTGALRGFWIKHTAGAWIIGRGHRIGRTVLKTSAMGLSTAERRPLHTAPPAIAARLLAGWSGSTKR